MEDKVAIDILNDLLKKYPLAEDEQQAILTAIGILAWTKLSEGHMKSLKQGREKRTSSEE
jgi:hypothetical protein